MILNSQSVYRLAAINRYCVGVFDVGVLEAVPDLLISRLKMTKCTNSSRSGGQVANSALRKRGLLPRHF